MLLAEAECLFLGFILFVSGVEGHANRICALKGSSVDLPCSPELPTSVNWYTVHWDGVCIRTNFSADGNRTTYDTSGESNFTLTMNDLQENDTNVYCCGNTDSPAGHCWYHRTQLQVTDLQVKVIPSTEGHTVTLMCSTSCPLTENPAAYIWYKNREFLYEDWSPWYQQLVSSEEAVNYSCAIKGYEDLRAPQVSVDSVTSACFRVTYAEGRMCSYVSASVDEPCSITYPTEVSIQSAPLRDHLSRLTCTPSCPLTHNQTSYRWYRSKRLYKYSESRHFAVYSDDVSCAVKGHEDLSAAGFCRDDANCSRESYSSSRRICAVEGSSVNFPSENLPYKQHECKRLFKMRRSGEDDVKELAEDGGRLEYHNNMNRSCILRIKELRKDDSAEYTFRYRGRHDRWEWSDYPGVTLVVTGLKVTFSPSAVVTEGQRVTLTCSTSCPLNTNYTWTLNGRPLTLPENQNNKQLVLDPVTGQQAGNYSCAVNSENNRMSPEATLTVLEISPSMATINAVRLAVAPLIPIPLLVFHLRMRIYLTKMVTDGLGHESCSRDRTSRKPGSGNTLRYVQYARCFTRRGENLLII